MSPTNTGSADQLLQWSLVVCVDKDLAHFTEDAEFIGVKLLSCPCFPISVHRCSDGPSIPPWAGTLGQPLPGYIATR